MPIPLRDLTVAGAQRAALQGVASALVTIWRMVDYYADALRAEGKAIMAGFPGKVDFAAIDAAIEARWPKRLDWLRERAWGQLLSRSERAKGGTT